MESQTDQKKYTEKGCVLHDVAKDWAMNDDPPPTYRKEGVHEGMSGVGTTRIDAILANQPAACMVHHISYNWEDGAGFDRVPIQVTLNMEALHVTMLTAAKSRPTNIADIKAHKWQPTDKHALYSRIWNKFKGRFEQAIEDKSPQQAHTVWCEALEEYLTQLQTPAARTPHFRKYPPKGQTMPLVSTTVATDFDERLMTEPNRITHLCRKLVGQCKRLADYLRQLARTGKGATDDDVVLRNFTQKLNQYRDNDHKMHHYTVEQLDELIPLTELSAKHEAAKQRAARQQTQRNRLTNN